MMLFHAPRRESRKQAGKLNTACIAIEGSRAACGEALSFGSAAASLQCVAPPELQAAAASAVPNAFGSVRHHASCCFPHASPALVFGAGKQKTIPRYRSKPVISFRKFGAGEGIRTLDPNLGKVMLLRDAIRRNSRSQPSLSISWSGKRNFAGGDWRAISGAERGRTVGIRFADRDTPRYRTEIARVFVYQETASVCRDCMVVDAVLRNRSPLRPLPANREKNREIGDLSPIFRLFSTTNRK